MYNLTPEESQLTKNGLTSLIKKHGLRDTNEDKIKVKYYTLLKAYKEEQEKESLRVTIKESLNLTFIDSHGCHP